MAVEGYRPSSMVYRRLANLLYGDREEEKLNFITFSLFLYEPPRIYHND